jgi:hypothetical protein
MPLKPEARSRSRSRSRTSCFTELNAATSQQQLIAQYFFPPVFVAFTSSVHVSSHHFSHSTTFRGWIHGQQFTTLETKSL